MYRINKTITKYYVVNGKRSSVKTQVTLFHFKSLDVANTIVDILRSKKCNKNVRYHVVYEPEIDDKIVEYVNDGKIYQCGLRPHNDGSYSVFVEQIPDNNKGGNIEKCIKRALHGKVILSANNKRHLEKATTYVFAKDIMTAKNIATERFIEGGWCCDKQRRT